MTVTVLYFILLLYCITVQYNDVDTLHWMLVYGIAAASLMPFIAGYKPPYIAQGIGCVALVMALHWSFISWPVNEEELREIGGLLLIMSGHFHLYITHRSSSDSQ
jgi:hypothetical protein